MEARLKLWLEQGDRLVLSDYRARLLRHVRDSGSLAHAAAAMGLSYRRAWGKVRELEANLGFALIVSDVGGVGGGKSRLTPEGEQLLAAYEAFLEVIQGQVQALYPRFFATFVGPSASQPSPGRLGQAGEEVQAIADHAVDTPRDES